MLVKKKLILSLTQFGFSQFTEIVMSTESMTNQEILFSELVLRLICQSVLQNPVSKTNPQQY